jgi:hypothetical protein
VELEEARRPEENLKRHNILTEEDDDLPNPQNTSISSSDDEDDALSLSDTDSSISGVGSSCGVSDTFASSPEPMNGSSGITLLRENDDYCPKKKKRFFSRFRRQQRQDTVPAVFDLEQYMMKREMTVTQEKWNALTVLPNAAYCIYFVLSAQWLSQLSVDSVVAEISNPDGMVSGCYNTSSSLWHAMPALPPLPVLAVAMGICLHTPWSFLYHWTYAHTMSATQRSKHWSRRMDQSMIHVASAFLSYGSSGSLNYLFANVLYNVDCVRRQFRPTVRPKRNQMRIFFSIVAYTLPLLKRGEYISFVHMWILFAISGWFFVQYPVGGWSHAVFHMVIAFVPPLLMRTATQLPASAPQLQLAALCAAASQHR